MRRIRWTFTRILAISVLALAAAGPAAAAAPTPAYGLTLSADASCTLSAKATFTHVKLTEIDVTWYMTGVARDPMSVLTSVHGRSAVATRAFFVDTQTTRDFYVTATFYSNGVLVATETSATITAGCGFALI